MRGQGSSSEAQALAWHAQGLEFGPWSKINNSMDFPWLSMFLHYSPNLAFGNWRAEDTPCICLMLSYCCAEMILINGCRWHVQSSYQCLKAFLIVSPRKNGAGIHKECADGLTIHRPKFQNQKCFKVWNFLNLSTKSRKFHTWLHVMDHRQNMNTKNIV